VQIVKLLGEARDRIDDAMAAMLCVTTRASLLSLPLSLSHTTIQFQAEGCNAKPTLHHLGRPTLQPLNQMDLAHFATTKMN